MFNLNSFIAFVLATVYTVINILCLWQLSDDKMFYLIPFILVNLLMTAVATIATERPKGATKVIGDKI